ncbi:NB-ARC domain-containing protein [Streptomyces sp. CB00455]|uniref:NB-ARC domain-containing protein n=1 Tax=Streptomyces sp. CB00455 TaxID=1703927 RepID=UPI001160E378|nr:NB-ARC domain-containing protein [Streptomyces sp. CB00455]
MGRTVAICLAAAVTAVVAVLASLAANAATAQDRWPGVLDNVRAAPWPWVGWLGAGAVALAVTAALLGREPSGGAQDPPPPGPPAVPAWVVGRAETRLAVAAVCGRGAGAVGITTALEGAGGFGKTTLATLVCANRRVRRRFRGRVYTVTIGRDVRARAAIAAKVVETTAFITGDSTAFEDPDRAGDHLGRLLDHRPRTLLVLDDVWEPEQLAPFLRGGRNCVRLVTTRVPAVLPDGAARLRVDEMTSDQARAVLTRDLPDLPEETVGGLLRATGRWALLLRLTNRLIVRRTSTGADPATAAAEALEDLRTGGPAVGETQAGQLDLDEPVRRSRAVRATVEAATTLLPAGGARRLAELGVFVEDESIPVPLVVRLWEATAGLAEARSRDLCADLDRLSLVTLSSGDGGRITLHDVLRDYLRGELGATALRELNAALVESALGTAALPAADVAGTLRVAAADGYLLDHLIEHLMAAGESARAERIAGDLRWVETRLHQRGPSAPWNDLARIPTEGAATLARDLSRIAHLLTPVEPARILTAVLHSRLAGLAHWDRQISVRQATDPGLRPLLTNHWPLPDTPDPALLRSLTGPEDPAHAVLTMAAGPGGAWVATGDITGELVVREPRTGTVLARHRYPGGVSAVVTDPAGGSLIVASGRTVLRVDPLRPQDAVPLVTAAEGVNLVAVAPDGSWYAEQASNGHVRVEDQDPATRLTSGRSAGVSLKDTLAASSDGRLLAASDAGGRMTLWDTGSPRPVTRIQASRTSPCTAAFSPDGAFLVSADERGVVRRWPVSGQLPGELGVDASHLVTRAAGPVRRLAVAPDGSWCATAGSDGPVRLWDLPDGRPRAVLTGHTNTVRALAISPDGSWLAAVGQFGGLRVWETTDGRPVTGADGHQNRKVTAVAYAPDGARVASVAHYDGAVLLHRAEDGVVAARLADDGYTAAPICFAPDGSWLACGGRGDTLAIWDPVSGSRRAQTDHYGHAVVHAVASAPDGSLLAAGTNRGVRLWDPVSGEPPEMLDTLSQVHAVLFSPDGSCLVTGEENGDVWIWDLFSRSRTARLRGGRGAVWALSMTSDGRWLFGAGHDGTVRLWDARRGAYRGLSTGNARPVRSVAISPDGRWIASVGDDATVRIWDRTGGQLVAAQRTEGALHTCSWRPDGGGLAIGGERGMYVYAFRPA